MEALSKLGIDYHYLLIQIINFGILFTVLSYLLYKPILKMLDKRKKEIIESMSKAERISEREQEMEREYERRLQVANHESEKIIQEAKDFSGKEKMRLLAQAEAEVAALKAKARAEIDHERSVMQAEVRQNVAHLTGFVLTKVLHIEASPAILEKTIQRTIDELK